MTRVPLAATTTCRCSTIKHRREPDDRGHFHWLIRLRGEEKGAITLWLSLRQRTVHVESEVSPRLRRIARRCFATY